MTDFGDKRVKKNLAVKTLRGYDKELMLIPLRLRIVRRLLRDNYVVVDVVQYITI